MSHDLRFSCDGVTVGTPGASILMQNGNGTGTGWLDAVFIAACSFAPFPALQRKVNQAYETIREQKPLFPHDASTRRRHPLFRPRKNGSRASAIQDSLAG